MMRVTPKRYISRILSKRELKTLLISSTFLIVRYMENRLRITFKLTVVGEEVDEELLVLPAYTSIEPETVVVVSFYTTSTVGTVVVSQALESLALLAYPQIIVL